jgi:hypothetical protein
VSGLICFCSKATTSDEIGLNEGKHRSHTSRWQDYLFILCNFIIPISLSGQALRVCQVTNAMAHVGQFRGKWCLSMSDSIWYPFTDFFGVRNGWVFVDRPHTRCGSRLRYLISSQCQKRKDLATISLRTCQI